MAEKDATVRLRRAVKENNLFLVKRLVKRTDMRNPDPAQKRFTSLAWAAVLGHEETFEFLLSSGHDDAEYSKDSENNTILILLAEARPPLPGTYGSGPSDHEFYSATLRMARLYYDRYPDILDWANSLGRTALHVASLKGNEELVRMLCNLGADFDLADNDGSIPLHYASAWGHIPIVQLLIERGCQYSVRNNEGFTPSDYAYSMSTREVLQDTARALFEHNKKARRNIFAQAAARGNEWGNGIGQLPPPPPRMYSGNSRMRSGSGTSRTTTTSDSGDWNENYYHASRNIPPPLSSSFSPPRSVTSLPPTTLSPTQPSGSSTGTNGFTVPSPGAQSQSSMVPPMTHLGLSPIASRMRERDAEAMEKYKLRQRSGSQATTSDVPSQTGSGMSSGGQEDEFASLNTLVTVGSVAPRRRLRPSASAAQLNHNSQQQQPLSPPYSSPIVPQADPRNRSDTSPGALRRQLSTSTSHTTSPPSESSNLPTPTQVTQNSRPSLQSIRPSIPRIPKDKEFSGPSADFAKFPPPPLLEPAPERTHTPTAFTRRLPFNLLSSHKNSSDNHGFGHKRNTSAHSLASRAT